MTSRKPLGRRIVANLGRKWVQVALTVFGFALAFVAVHRFLGPKPPPTAAERKAIKYKFMHCDQCLVEMEYNEVLVDKVAQTCRCEKGKAGVWTPTEESIKTTAGDPNVKYYTALFVGGVLFLAVLYFLLARKDPAPTHFYVRCLHCREMLRYTADGFDKLVACPTCEQPIRLPDEDEAMTDEDVQEERTDLTLGEYEARLRAGGYTFPHERPDDDPSPDGDPTRPTPDAPR